MYSQRDVIAIESSDEEEENYINKTYKKPNEINPKASNSTFNLNFDDDEDDEPIEPTFMVEKDGKKKEMEEKKKSKQTKTNSNSNKRSAYSSLTISKRPKVDNNNIDNNGSDIVNLDDDDYKGGDDNTQTKKSSSKRKSKNNDDSDNNNNNNNKRSANDDYQYDDGFNSSSNNNNTNSILDDDDDIPDSELEQEFTIPSKKSSYTTTTTTTTTSKSSSSSSSSKKKSKSTSNSKKKTPKLKKITKTSCLEETFIIFDKNLENELGMDDIKAQLESKTPNIEFSHSSIPYSIRFVRKLNNNNDNDDDDNDGGSGGDDDEENDHSDNKITENKQYEKFVILKYSAKMLTQLIQNNELIEKISKVKRDNPTCNFTLLIESLDSYLQQISKSISKQTIQKGLSDKNLNALTMNLPPTKVTIEKILVQVQMEFSITIRTIENRNDIVNFLFKSFQTIALLPLRNEDQLFEGFCADSIKKRKQTSLSDTWSNQLCQITGISSNIARGITAKYPTITSLFSFYGDSYSEKEKENLLRDVKIDQNRGTKNLGPVLSSKIYHIFSSKDPNRIIY
ncbi:hypothetical protein ACTA71_001965 [Dictyostelium dimigraforme]